MQVEILWWKPDVQTNCWIDSWTVRLTDGKLSQLCGFCGWWHKDGDEEDQEYLEKINTSTQQIFKVLLKPSLVSQASNPRFYSFSVFASMQAKILEVFTWSESGNISARYIVMHLSSHMASKYEAAKRTAVEKQVWVTDMPTDGNMRRIRGAAIRGPRLHDLRPKCPACSARDMHCKDLLCFLLASKPSSNSCFHLFFRFSNQIFETKLKKVNICTVYQKISKSNSLS